MAITTNGSYLPTMDDFLAHWALCDDLLGAAPLVAVAPGKSAVTQALFETNRTDLIAAQQEVQSELSEQQITRGDIDLKKVALLAVLNGFVGVMEAYYQVTKFYNAKPLVPSITEGQERFLSPMVDGLTLWGKMNRGAAPEGVALPLVVGVGTDVAAFRLAIDALQTAYRAEKSAIQSLALARATRNTEQALAYETMKAYRLAMPIRLSQNAELISTLPKLTPDGGHTPVAVQVSGAYVAPSTSHVVYTASEEAMLSHYELEGCNGEEFIGEDAVFLGRREVGDPLEFTVAFGLTQPGTAAAFKVFVVLTTGNRAGSVVVVVRRPLV